MYNSQEEFEADYLPAEKAALEEIGGVAWSIDSAWGLYIHQLAPEVEGAKEPKLPFQLFGRHVYDKNGAVRRDAYHPDQAGRIGIGAAEFGSFEPLYVGDEWNVAINDTWLLGGVNSLQEFHAASPINEDNIYKEEYEHKLTVTGRELFCLALAGYQATSGHQALNTVYHHGDKEKAGFLRLTDIMNEIKKITSVDAAKAIFKNAGFRILEGTNT